MAIPVLADVILPPRTVQAGVSGSNLRNNTRSTNQGGYGSVNVNWTRTLRQFELGVVARLVADWMAIEGLHEETEGGAFGFLMEDPKDSTVLAGQGLLAPFTTDWVGAPGLGYGVPSYKLMKRYPVLGSTTRFRDRALTRPKSFPMLRGGVPVVMGIAAGNAAESLGVITFVPDATNPVNAVTVGASTIVRLTATVGLAVGDRLWLQGMTGADAALLNDKSHQITAVTSGVFYTLAVDTAGKAINVSGAGAAYPQADETLTWTGSFYVPVHFMSDSIDWELLRGGQNAQRLVGGPSIVVQEIRE